MDSTLFSPQRKEPKHTTLALREAVPALVTLLARLSGKHVLLLRDEQAGAAREDKQQLGVQCLDLAIVDQRSAHGMGWERVEWGCCTVP